MLCLTNCKNHIEYKRRLLSNWKNILKFNRSFILCNLKRLLESKWWTINTVLSQLMVNYFGCWARVKNIRIKFSTNISKIISSPSPKSKLTIKPKKFLKYKITFHKHTHQHFSTHKLHRSDIPQKAHTKLSKKKKNKTKQLTNPNISVQAFALAAIASRAKYKHRVLLPLNGKVSYRRISQNGHLRARP